MGWLTDVGNIAVGAIDRDRQITKEDLAIRAENLQANRNMLIKQKEKKYDKELENYYEEKKKFDNINEMNKRYESGAIDKGTYAAFALSSTMPGWDKLSKERKYELETNFDGKTIDYKLTGSPEEINKKAAAAQTMINDETSKRIQDAKGNSFLINTILGDKKKAEVGLLKAMESKLNAAETVNMTEQSTEHSGLDVKVGGAGTFNFDRWTKQDKNKAWVKRFNDLDDRTIFKSAANNNNFLNFLKTSDILGTSTEANYKLSTDGTEIEGLPPSARALLKTYEMVYNDVVKAHDAKALALAGIDITQLKDYVSLEAVNKRVQNLIEERSFVVKTGYAGGTIGDNPREYVGFVPLNVVDIDGNFTLDSGAKKRVRMDGIKIEMENFVTSKAAELIKNNPDKYKKSKNPTDSAMSAIQASIEAGGDYNDELKLYLQGKMSRDNPDTPENESITQHPKVLADEKMANEDVWAKKPPIIRDPIHQIVEKPDGELVFRPSTEGVNKGIRIMKSGTGFQQKQPNGNWKPILWEEVKKNNEVNNLPPYLKLKYDLWEEGKLEQAGKSTQVKETEKEYLPNKIFTVD